MAWIHIPTGASAALDDHPEQSFTGFVSGETVIASIAKHVSVQEAEDLVEGVSGYTPEWFANDMADAREEIFLLEFNLRELAALDENEESEVYAVYRF